MDLEGVFLSNRMSYLLAVLILLLAAGLRMWELTTLQPGLNTDEITTLQVIERVRDGQIAVFHDMGDVGGREGLYPMGVLLVTLFTGEGLPGYRMLTVWTSLITLALTYSLGVRLFGRVAGIASMTLLSVLMLDILLARLLLSESLLVLLITATLLVLARALPVYRDIDIDSSNTISFAALGVLPAVALYVHPAGLLLTAVCAAFIFYILLFHSRTARSRAGYIGFTLLVFGTLSIPYFTSSINRASLAAATRLFASPDNLFQSIADTLSAFVFQGDMSPLYNFSGRPLVDLLTGFFILIGVLIVIRGWRYPRFALPLIAGLFFLPYVIFAPTAADFSRFMILSPILVLFFGLSVRTLLSMIPKQRGRMVVLALLVLFGFNCVWAGRDVFIRWSVQDDMGELYHHREGLLATYLDRTVQQTPTVLCDTNVTGDTDAADMFNAVDLIQRLMNRKTLPLRRIDCRSAYLFINGGEREQIILPDDDVQQQIMPYLYDWLTEAREVTGDDVPSESVFMMDVPETLADRVGRFTTTSSVRYPQRIDGDFPASFPPVQMGENVTFLGYEIDDNPVYAPGDTLKVIHYWRIDGEVPDTLMLFVHILSDPVTIAAQRAQISVLPGQLSNRDVFVQVTDVQLPETMLPGEYTVSVVAEARPDVRLMAVRPDYDIEVDRLFLYPVTVNTQEESE